MNNGVPEWREIADLLDEAAADKDVSHAQFRVLYRLARLSKTYGKAWAGGRSLENTTTVSRKWIGEAISRLEAAGWLKCEPVLRGDLLPSGSTAKTQHTVYTLCRPQRSTQGSEDVAAKTGVVSTPREPRTTGVVSTPGESSTPGGLGSDQQGNQVPETGELGSSPLCESDHGFSKPETTRASARRSDAGNRLLKKSPSREPEPKGRAAGLPSERLEGGTPRRRSEARFSLDTKAAPREFRDVYNEALVDGRSLIPEEVTQAVHELAKRGWLETIRNGKIESVGWTEPATLRELLARPPLPRLAGLDALLAETALKMRL